MLCWLTFEKGKNKGQVLEFIPKSVATGHNQFSMVVYLRVKDLKTGRVYNTQSDTIKIRLVKPLSQKQVISLVNRVDRKGVYNTSVWDRYWRF